MESHSSLRSRPSSASVGRPRRPPILNIRRSSLPREATPSTRTLREQSSFAPAASSSRLGERPSRLQRPSSASTGSRPVAQARRNRPGSAPPRRRAVQSKALAAELAAQDALAARKTLQNSLQSSDRSAGVQRLQRRAANAWGGSGDSTVAKHGAQLHGGGSQRSTASSLSVGASMTSRELEGILAENSSMAEITPSLFEADSRRWEDPSRLYLKYKFFEGPEVPRSWAPWFVSRRGAPPGGYLAHIMHLHRHLAIEAALAIQRVFRRWFARGHFLDMKQAAVTIQKHARGHRSRVGGAAVKAVRERASREWAAAICIQKFQRGRMARTALFTDLRPNRVGVESAVAAAIAALPDGPPPSPPPPRKPLMEVDLERLRWLVEEDGPYNWNRKSRQIGRSDWPGEELCRVMMRMQRQDQEARAAAEALSAEAVAAREAAAAAAAVEANAEEKRKRAQKDALKWTLLGVMPRDPSIGNVAEVGHTHNASVAYRLTAEQKAAAEEASILGALLAMIKPSKAGNGGSVRTLYGEAVTSTDAAFQIIDKDNSGTIELDELSAGLKRLGLGLTDSQLDRLHESLDTDGDGTMSKEEFVDGLEALVKKKQAKQAAEKARRDALAGQAPGGRMTEYLRPWTCSPEPMTMAQKLQRAVFKQVMAQRFGGVLLGLKPNKERLVHAVEAVLLAGPADSNKCAAAVESINGSKGERHLLLLSTLPKRRHDDDGDDDGAAAGRLKYKLEGCYYLPTDTEDARWRRIFGRAGPFELPRSCGRLPAAGVESEGLIFLDEIFRSLSKAGDPQMADDPVAADDSASLDAVILRPRKAAQPEKKYVPSSVGTAMTDRTLLLNAQDEASTTGRVMKLEHALRRAERLRRLRLREEKQSKSGKQRTQRGSRATKSAEFGATRRHGAGDVGGGPSGGGPSGAHGGAHGGAWQVGQDIGRSGSVATVG